MQYIPLMSFRDNSIDSILAQLAALAARPLDQAHAMPPEVYTSEHFLERERERIFRGGWVCAGRTDSLRSAGEYFCFDVDSQPVFVVRQKDGSFSAFANVCRHRMMTLLKGQGKCKRIVCPYHAWTYDVNGALLNAPHMDSRSEFDQTALGLHPVRLEVWHGWIYLTLNNDAPTVDSLLEKLSPLVAPYQMEHYVQILEEDHVWDTNWKQLTENFMEGYHLPVAHKATVGGYFPVEATQFAAVPSPGFTFQFFEKTTEAPVGTAHPDNKTLRGKQRVTSVMPTVFPSHMYVLAPDHLWYLSLQPQGVSQVKIRYGIAMAPEVLETCEDPDKLIADTAAFLWQVNEEDRVVVEGIHKGAHAPLSTSGPLCWLERENHEFAQYLAAQLCN
ncbi:MAG: Rieske 2Fe-2S domain-containing protein [Acidiferrobacterales bacterium]|nr:Rieske 2Fe-2S domain-containing protein [Acidiferrobacterales bacterium]